MSFISPTNNSYVGSIQTPTDTVGSVTGLGALDEIRTNLENIQKMVFFDEKRIATNVISRFDQTPIQVVDPINISTFITLSGLSLLGNSSTEATQSTTLLRDSYGIVVQNSTIQFVGDNKIFAQFSRNGNLSFQNSTIHNGFTLRGSNVSSQFLKADTNGEAYWSHVNQLVDGDMMLKINGNNGNNGNNGHNVVSSVGVFQLMQGGIRVSQFDGRGNLVLGSAHATSQDENTLIVSNIRFTGENLEPGSVLVAKDAFGTLGFQRLTAPDGTVVINAPTNQITCNVNTILVDSTSIRFGLGGSEKLRVNSSGFLGIGTNNPIATLDVDGKTRLSTLTLHGGSPSSGLALFALNTEGQTTWAPVTNLLNGNSRLELQDTALVGTISNIEVIRATTSNIVLERPTNINGLLTVQRIVDSEVLRLGAGSIQAINILSSGRVGFFTNAPTQSIDIAGDVRVRSSFQVDFNIESVFGVFNGNGTGLTNLNFAQIGTGSNNLSNFYFTQRATNAGLSTLLVSTANQYTTLSTLIALVDTQTDKDFAGQIGIISTQISTQRIFILQETSNFTTVSSSNVLSTAIVATLANTNIIINLSSAVSTFVSTVTARIVSTNFAFQTADAQNFSTLSSILRSATISLNTNLNDEYTAADAIVSNSLLESIRIVSNINHISTFSTLLNAGLRGLNSNIRSGLNTEFLLVNTDRGEPRFNFPNTRVDISGSVVMSRSSILYMQDGALGINRGPRIGSALDVSGVVYIDNIVGTPVIRFGIGSQSNTAVEIRSDGALITGLARDCNYTPAIQANGDIVLTGSLIKDGRPYALTPVIDFYWGRSNSNVFFNDGNVGIGMTQPQYPLDVNGEIRCRGIQILGPMNNGLSTSLTYQNLGNINPWEFRSSNIFYQLGHVGLGESNPLYQLDVKGSAVFKGGPVWISTQMGIGLAPNSDLSGVLDVRGAPAYFQIIGGGVAGTDHLPILIRETEVTRFSLDGVSVNGDLDVSGSVDVEGTLQVNGGINITGNLSRNGVEISLSNQWLQLSTNVAYTNGNVGIGTVNPTHKLDVNGTIRCRAIEIMSDIDSGVIGDQYEPTSVGAFQILRGSANAQYISTGKVGIGTSTPSHKLHVVGDIRVSDMLIANTISTSVLLADSIFSGQSTGIAFLNESVAFINRGNVIAQFLSTGKTILGAGTDTYMKVNNDIDASVAFLEGGNREGAFFQLRADSFPLSTINVFASQQNSNVVTEYTVPPGTESMNIVLVGGGGGGMVRSDGIVNAGGGGAALQGTLQVVANTELRVTVGSGGVFGSQQANKPSGGGGFSKVERKVGTNWELIVIVGGGGGAGVGTSGGAATASGISFTGGNIEQTVVAQPLLNALGLPNGGGASDIGGEGGFLETGIQAGNGSFGLGGTAGPGAGAVGGGGYYGGGGGVEPGAAGGGSAYYNPNFITNVVLFDGNGSVAGQVNNSTLMTVGRGGITGAGDGGRVLFYVEYMPRVGPLIEIREGLLSNSSPNPLFVINRVGEMGIMTAPTSGIAIDVAGTIRANVFVTNSDQRLKTVLGPWSINDRGIQSVPLHRFVWNADDRADSGFLAQELEAVFPDCVKTDSDGWKTVDTYKVITVLWGSLQKTMDRLDAVEAHLQH